MVFKVKLLILLADNVLKGSFVKVTGTGVGKLNYNIQCSPLNSGSVNSEILLIQTGDYGPC